MSKQFEAVREILLSGGIAPGYVRRYLRELNDHLIDLTKAQRAAGYEEGDAVIRARAAMGNETDLAQAMLARPGFRSLSARAPWLVFGIAPVFLTFAMIALIMLLMFFTGWLSGLIHQMDLKVAPAWFRLLCQLAALIATFLIPLLTASMFVVLAARQRMSLLWPLLGIAVIVIFGMQMDASFPGPGMRGGSIGLGFSVMSIPDRLQGHPFHVQWLLFLAQLGLSLLPALWLLIWRQRATISRE